MQKGDLVSVAGCGWQQRRGHFFANRSSDSAASPARSSARERIASESCTLLSVPPGAHGNHRGDSIDD
jgi:hypothetical protein